SPPLHPLARTGRRRPPPRWNFRSRAVAPQRAGRSCEDLVFGELPGLLWLIEARKTQEEGPPELSLQVPRVDLKTRAARELKAEILWPRRACDRASELRVRLGASGRGDRAGPDRSPRL